MNCYSKQMNGHVKINLYAVMIEGMLKLPWKCHGDRD